MPAYRKPTGLLALSGAFEKNPQRRPVGPKSDRPIGGPPACLVPDEAACWREFVANAPAGVLTSGDRWALERLCCLMARSRREGLTGGELGHLRALLGEMGASPASRGRCSRMGLPRRPRRTLGTWRRRAGPRAVASAVGGGGAHTGGETVQRVHPTASRRQMRGATRPGTIPPASLLFL